MFVCLCLIGHNNPINGFRPAATQPSRRLCFLRAFASWLHQSMTGLPRFGLTNGYKVVLFVGFRRTSHQIRCTTSTSLRSSYSSLLNRMRKSLPIRTGPMILRRTFLSNTFKATASVHGKDERLVEY